MKPTFQSQEVERKRKEILSEILSEKDEPGVIARKAFDEILFGHHPYHHPVNGLEKTLPSIGREDTLNFHREYYRPNNAIITMVGDLTEMEARRWVDKYFGPWAKGGIQTPKILPISSIKTKQVKVIDKEITQANIVLGHLGISRNDPDYHAISVMNYILGGGGFASRMMTRIRDNEGLAYGVYSRFDANLDPGSFSVVLQTKNASANQAITEVLEEIRRIQIKPVTDQELDESRSYLVGSFPLRLDTSSKLSNFLSMVEFNGLGLDYIEKYPKLIASVTKEEILRVAKTYLQPDRFILVVVANESEAKVESKHESKEIK
jgi:zinc protease